MTYDEAVKRWVAAKYGWRWEFIDEVRFEFQPAGSYEHSGDYDARMIVSVRAGGGFPHFSFAPDSFGSVLQEIVAIALGGS